MSRVLFCRSVNFAAEHYYKLPGLTESQNFDKFGDSSKPHAHVWQLTLWLEGPLDENGMMVDLHEIDAIMHDVAVKPFNRKCINDQDPFFRKNQPTNEVLAGYFAEKLLPRLPVPLVKLRIAEADDLYAEWLP